MAGDKLRAWPNEAVTPDLLGTLRAHKAELLRLLNAKSHHATAARCGSPHCAGCYSVGVIDGRERFLHPPKGKPIDWTAWNLASEEGAVNWPSFKVNAS